jgi:uncharacterized protein YdeI (BOF family)
MTDEIQTPQKPKKPLIGKTWKESRVKSKHIALGFLGGLILVIIICAVTGGEKKNEVPQIPFSQQEVTESSVQEVIERLRGVSVELEGNVTKVEVSKDYSTQDIPGGKLVVVYYNPESVWDEKDAMEVAVHTAIKTMEALFENPKIARVVIRQQGDFTDKYGKTKTELAIRIAMDKETADKVADWETVDDRAWGDYNTFLNLADLQYVHPAISKGL